MALKIPLHALLLASCVKRLSFRFAIRACHIPSHSCNYRRLAIAISFLFIVAAETTRHLLQRVKVEPFSGEVRSVDGDVGVILVTLRRTLASGLPTNGEDLT